MRRLAALATLLAALVPGTALAQGRSAEAVPGSYIVTYDDDVSDPGAATTARERRGGFKAVHRYRHALKGFSARLSQRQVDELRADPAVRSVVRNLRVRARGEIPAGVQRMGAAFEGGPVNPAATVGVAVIDSGIDLDHPDLNVVGNKNCVGGATGDDDAGHGTHVAGSIAARANGTGVLGVAPGSRLYAVKVLDSAGNGTWDQVICGIDWVTANRASIGVANMSLGGLGTSADNNPCGTTSTTPLRAAICRSTASGVRYVVAAGNDAWPFPHATAPDVPSSYDEVVTVTAMGDTDGYAGAVGATPSCRSGEADDRYAAFSNWSDNATDNAHTLAAPGVCVLSTYPGGGYHTESGTSMASPHVAGAVALCASEAGCPTAPADIVKRITKDGDASRSTWGYTGDPFRPITGRYYGYFATAGTPRSAPTFSLSATPTSRTVLRGGTTTYGVTSTAIAGFNSNVSLSLSGAPRSTWSFSPSVIAGGSGSSTLTITVASTASRGTYTMRITGTGGGQTKSTNVTLTVQ